MSINVQVSPSPSVNISVGNGGNLLNLTPQAYTLHANTHVSGGIDAINHNNLLGLQGGASEQYYHLTSGQYNNLNNIVYNTGNQNISGIKNFYSRPTVNGTGVLLIADLNDPAGVIIGSDGVLNQFGTDAYQNIFGDNAVAGNIFGNSSNYNQFGDGADDNYFGNNIIGFNYFGNNSPYNDFGAYAENYFGNDGTNTYYSGNVVGLLAFNTRPTVNGVGVLLIGEGGGGGSSGASPTDSDLIIGLSLFL